VANPEVIANPNHLVLIVDDNEFNRDGVALYLRSLGFRTVEAGDEAEALTLAEATHPWAAVVDIVIPKNEESKALTSESVGLNLVRRLKIMDPMLGIVIFSAYEDRSSQVWELVREGVRGVAYLLKGNRPEKLLQALYDTVAGRVILDVNGAITRNELIRDIRAHLTPAERPWVERAVQFIPLLSPREWDIASRLANSQNNQGISEVLGIKSKTVENHISRVYDKLGLGELENDAPTLRKSLLLAKAFMIYDLSGMENED
jgi:DNA-binding NarL/FixJ family response regulator